MQPVLLCLHGWGGSKESFTELREALKDANIDILTPDLPGFGDEPEPQSAWTNDDYAQWVEHWLQAPGFGERKDNNRKLFLLGHSHGGRIAIKIASRNNTHIEHVFLCAAAGIQHPNGIKQRIGYIAAKVGSAVMSVPVLKSARRPAAKALYKILGVHDYEQASPVMRQTMQAVKKENIEPLLERIRVPTDIFWGTEDTQTPLSDGYAMQKGIKGSRLHVFQGVRHRVHRDKARDIAKAIVAVKEGKSPVLTCSEEE